MIVPPDPMLSALSAATTGPFYGFDPLSPQTSQQNIDARTAAAAAQARMNAILNYLREHSQYEYQNALAKARYQALAQTPPATFVPQNLQLAQPPVWNAQNPELQQPPLKTPQVNPIALLLSGVIGLTNPTRAPQTTAHTLAGILQNEQIKRNAELEQWRNHVQQLLQQHRDSTAATETANQQAVQNWREMNAASQENIGRQDRYNRELAMAGAEAQTAPPTPPDTTALEDTARQIAGMGNLQDKLEAWKLLKTLQGREDIASIGAQSRQNVADINAETKKNLAELAGNQRIALQGIKDKSAMERLQARISSTTNNAEKRLYQQTVGTAMRIAASLNNMDRAQTSTSARTVDRLITSTQKQLTDLGVGFAQMPDGPQKQEAMAKMQGLQDTLRVLQDSRNSLKQRTEQIDRRTSDIMNQLAPFNPMNLGVQLKPVPQGKQLPTLPPIHAAPTKPTQQKPAGGKATPKRTPDQIMQMLRNRYINGK